MYENKIKVYTIQPGKMVFIRKWRPVHIHYETFYFFTPFLAECRITNKSVPYSEKIESFEDFHKMFVEKLTFVDSKQALKLDKIHKTGLSNFINIVKIHNV